MKRFLLIGVLLALLMPLAADASTSNGHWPGIGERTVTVYDMSRFDAWNAPLRAAASEWSKSPYINLAVVRASPPAPGTCPDAQGAAINFCTDSMPNANWTGYAHQIVVDGHYYGALAWINNQYESSWSYSGRQWVSCHELGHDLGITSHETGKRAGCVGGQSAYPSAANYQFLAEIYSHPDSASATRAGAQ